MKRYLLLTAMMILGLASCKKDEVPAILPEAGFTVDGFNASSSSPSVLTMGPWDQATVTNNSVNADSYVWDFGNGTTSTEKAIVLQYPAAGTYTLTLTAITKNGKTAVAKKVVKIVEPVLKEVVISKLLLNSTVDRPASLTPFTKADVWVEIVRGEQNNFSYPYTNGSFSAPVFYKSNIAANVDSANAPLVFSVAGRKVFDIPALTRDFGYKGIGYGFNLYAKDATGTYLLASSFWSGVSAAYQGSYEKNSFAIPMSFLGFSMTFKGTYE